MTLILDAGHGIDTPGKRSPDGCFLEYLWNRQIAERVYYMLRACGADVRMLVRETNDIALRTRVMRANAIATERGVANTLVVSIHSNAAGDGSKWQNAQGWSCYTSKGRTSADKAAECMYDAFEAEFKDRKIRKDMSDGDRDWEEDFYVLKHTKSPAILLENFFYDNREECSWLLKEETKNRIASTIVKGLLNYVKG